MIVSVLFSFVRVFNHPRYGVNFIAYESIDIGFIGLTVVKMLYRIMLYVQITGFAIACFTPHFKYLAQYLSYAICISVFDICWCNCYSLQLYI